MCETQMPLTQTSTLAITRRWVTSNTAAAVFNIACMGTAVRKTARIIVRTWKAPKKIVGKSPDGTVERRYLHTAALNRLQQIFTSPFLIF